MNVEQLKNPTFDFKHYQDEKQERFHHLLYNKYIMRIRKWNED